MIVVMKPNCSEAAIEHVLRFLEQEGFTGHLSRGVERTVIGVIGSVNVQNPPGKGMITPALGEALEAFPEVEGVFRVSKPYKLASREFHPDDTVVEVPVACVAGGTVRIGGPAVVMMAGPCTVENEKQLMTTAEAVRKAGAVILRGGAFKPSTSPYGFRGLGEEGLKLLAKASREFGMAVVTEVMTPADVPLVCEYADILQIGTRNMQNYMLLDEVGRAQKPVLLKRGMAATIEEWLLAAEYILSQGNRAVILCERGIRTFEKSTRNTMDLSAIPLVKQLSHLPIVADPSQGTGRRDLVAPMTLAAVAAGCDGLLIEVHPNPEVALKDGAQSLTTEQFAELMPRAEAVAQAIGRSFVTA
ncbi:MAG: 3-deoxy-7-phosphoheptulonate synthase [Thermogemmatispora sp.]|jgi:3-deoxy-7-phosphoheptulonate synthase|uniref:3-deoxy-7-phosphoheptulonate synthase n=1 Tax=Thermogemmatispora aurantia TaxID=2045279 RepID=A0A5J4K2M9_9CHLR|nr:MULTISPECIES: 3-deoxy-7-phosphoheptulonate synthase [Thermogemmatispora]MBE3568326.1 3-deoxy-7-phosphoheptulonate synthase [Thermogemmatispora sp.]GER83118.1 3-deoxy-7-phosphoheptulonate synthase [Thermogemmatispora aurantia]